jgi:hypothetical protein
MSELYRHLLIPQDAAFVPELDTVARFFTDMETLGALPKETTFAVVTRTGETRAWGRNPETGEVYFAPALKVSRFSELQPAIDSLLGVGIFDLSASGLGPTSIPPFDLYSADNYRTRQPGILWQKPYELNVRCKLRQDVTHFLHSSFGCKCDLKPDELAVFDHPWNGESIQTGALGCARFWIEFGIGDYLIPMVTNRLDILDTRLVKATSDLFGIEFGQGCIRNDD